MSAAKVLTSLAFASLAGAYVVLLCLDLWSSVVQRMMRIPDTHAYVEQGLVGWFAGEGHGRVRESLSRGVPNLQVLRVHHTPVVSQPPHPLSRRVYVAKKAPRTRASSLPTLQTAENTMPEVLCSRPDRPVYPPPPLPRALRRSGDGPRADDAHRPRSSSEKRDTPAPALRRRRWRRRGGVRWPRGRRRGGGGGGGRGNGGQHGGNQPADGCDEFLLFLACCRSAGAGRPAERLASSRSRRRGGEGGSAAAGQGGGGGGGRRGAAGGEVVS